MVTTTIEIPVELRDRLRGAKAHPRQPYHEIIDEAMDAWDDATGEDPILKRHRGAIKRAVQRHGLEVRIVGPRARGKGTKTDPLSMVYKTDEGRSMYDVAAFVVEVERMTGCPVKMAARDAMPKETRKKRMQGAKKL